MKKIVVGYDSSDQAADALSLADALRLPDDGELIVASVEEAEPVFCDIPEWQEQMRCLLRSRLCSRGRPAGPT